MLFNHEAAIKALLLRAKRAKGLGKILREYAKQLESDREIPLAERYTWAINEIENFIRNIDFSELARHTRNIDK